jgi:hypothetical protein
MGEGRKPRGRGKGPPGSRPGPPPSPLRGLECFWGLQPGVVAPAALLTPGYVPSPLRGLWLRSKMCGMAPDDPPALRSAARIPRQPD